MQAYKDGACGIFAVENAALPGKKAVQRLIPKIPLLRYEERVTGMKRFYTAMQADTMVDMVIRCPRVEISRHDVAVIGDEQYDIELIQYPPEIKPPSMDLTLRRLEAKYV